jgi:outer membrane biosynthesis protein TonB
MVLYRVWQAILSVLAVGGFLALEYLAGREVDPLVPVILSWVTVAAPVLLAIGWVVKKQYWRTLAVAALVAAVRVSLERTLSDFLTTAGWFLIGAIVLVVIIGLVTRWVRRGRAAKPAQKPAQTPAQKPIQTPMSAAPKPAVAPVVQDVKKESPVVAPPQLMQFARVEESTAVKAPEPNDAAPRPATVAPQPKPAEPKGAAPRVCGKCGAPNRDEDAVFCRSCGASLAQ